MNLIKNYFMYKKGQKLVCINDKNIRNRRYMINIPKRDQIYTFRNWSPTSPPSILLEELKNLNNNSGFENGFLTYRFVPLEKYFNDQTTNDLERIKIEVSDKEFIKEFERIN